YSSASFRSAAIPTSAEESLRSAGGASVVPAREGCQARASGPRASLRVGGGGRGDCTRVADPSSYSSGNRAWRPSRAPVRRRTTAPAEIDTERPAAPRGAPTPDDGLSAPGPPRADARRGAAGRGRLPGGVRLRHLHRQPLGLRPL